MLRKFLLLLVLSNICFSIHHDILKKYQNGLDAYSDGNYQLTIQEMESILRQNWESPQLYYNLGNAYFREKGVGGSVWAYEKCLLLDPSHSDAKYNLSIANLNVIDKIETPEEDYSPDKIDSDITVDKLQEQRMNEIPRPIMKI